jgi:hypothetical protein
LYQCRCMAKNSWWWAERLPKTCRVLIPIKLELSTSVGFIHKEFVCCVTDWHAWEPERVFNCRQECIIASEVRRHQC